MVKAFLPCLISIFVLGPFPPSEDMPGYRVRWQTFLGLKYGTASHISDKSGTLGTKTCKLDRCRQSWCYLYFANCHNPT